MEYGINPNTWYSPNDIVRDKLLFGKSKRYVFDLIKLGTLSAVNTSTTSKPQWKILGADLIALIKEMDNKVTEGTDADSNITDPEL